MARILIVDDDREMGELLRERLVRRNFDVRVESSPEEALELLAAQDFDVVVTDVRMRGISGIELCERVTANRPDIPVLVITAFGSLDTAISAIRAGAHDFLPKPFEVEELAFRLDRALQHRRLTEEVRRLREVTAAHEVTGLLGESLPLRKLRELVARIAGADAPVLLTGETGSGKELVARAIHRQGARRAGPFVAINCAALPAALLESELFGHARGAFTDAHVARNGLLVGASGGTLFLDEIGELPLPLQPKLLRTLQERRVRPLGAAQEVPFDARLVAATNTDLESAVEEGRFREDLMFRLDVLRVDVPPLRARGSDVLLLAQEFTRRAAARTGKPVVGLSRAAAEKLLSYAWPGNVRELENCVERAVALTQHEQILVDDLPERIRDYRRAHVLVAGEDPSELVAMEEVERRYIARVLEAVGGNKTLAARILGFDRKTLYRKLDVEDDPDMRKLLAAVLRRDGYRVVEATDGDDALEWLGDSILSGKPERLPAVIVSDICLPYCSGFDILEGARLSPRRPPVVLITAFGDEETHSSARELGAVCVLDKPFAMEELREAVKTALRPREQRPPKALDGHMV